MPGMVSCADGEKLFYSKILNKRQFLPNPNTLFFKRTLCYLLYVSEYIERKLIEYFLKKRRLLFACVSFYSGCLLHVIVDPRNFGVSEEVHCQSRLLIK